jgi:CheY-like chemotaxis protein
VLVFRDVSERRRVEAERAEASVERERLLQSERQARAEAERSSRMKDEFVAMVSHELRTPLNAILGWSQMLTHSTKPEEVQRGLDVIQRNTRLQAQLISDLLDISRIVAGKLRLDLADVDLAAVVEDAVVSAQVAARAKNITLERKLDDDVGVTTGDPARLLQCVSNLLSNAIKFTPEGGHVTASLHRVDSHAEIKVSDTGIGIRPDFLPYVFERFQQAESQTTRRFGGLGLGLAIVKQLVHMHGGHARAESAGEGKGATFTLELPIAASPSVPAEPSDRSRRVEPLSLEGVKVLLVEDDADTRELLRRLLEEQRAEVLAAATASEALNALESARPHILLSDIGLPDIDGYQLMKRVRSLPPTKGGTIPAIALTAYARSEDRTKALRAGYQAHIAKPVEPSELVASIASFAGLVAAAQRPEL